VSGEGQSEQRASGAGCGFQQSESSQGDVPGPEPFGGTWGTLGNSERLGDGVVQQVFFAERRDVKG